LDLRQSYGYRVDTQTVFTIGVGYDLDKNNAEMFPKRTSALKVVAF